MCSSFFQAVNQKSAPSTSPPARVAAACHVVRLIFALMKRTLPSHRATLLPAPGPRSADRPPPPPQLTSGFSSLSRRVAVNVPCKKRPSSQFLQRSPAMFLLSFHSLTPPSRFTSFTPSFFYMT